MKKLLPFLCIFIGSCSYQNASLKTDDYSLPNKIDSETKLSLNKLELDAYNTKGLIGDLLNIKSWFSYYLVKHHKMVIDKVILSDNNKRIDDSGTDSITPDYSGKDINITISGKFDKDVVKSDNIFYKNDTNLLQISYVGELLPRTKILIDDSILLEPISATTTLIKLKIKTEAIPDYYLKGIHKLSIVSDRDRTDTLIRIGVPEAPKSSLSPTIDEIKIIRAKDVTLDLENVDLAFKTSNLVNNLIELSKYKPDDPINIKIKGKNLMMFYKFSYSVIDGKFGFGHSTAISKNSQGNTIWESIIHIPDPKEFHKKNEHFLSYSTPFGTAIKRF